MGISQRFICAIVGQPFGLTGKVKITCPSGESGHIFKLKRAVLRGKNDSTEREIEIEEVTTPPLCIKFAGIDNSEAAKTIAGAKIFVPREQAAPLLPKTYYIEDLKGLSLVHCGRTIGSIVDIIEGGGAQLAEILLESGEKKLVPFRSEFFGAIDIDLGQAELFNLWILE